MGSAQRRPQSLRDATLEAVVEEALGNRPEAFYEIVRRFRGSAEAWALAVLHDRQLAQDATQEAFVEAFAGLEKLRERAAFAGWFRRIVFKQADRIRRRPGLRSVALDRAEMIPDTRPGPDARVLAKQQNRSFRRTVGSLPEHERIVVTLFYAADQSHAEIEERLVLPRSTVKKRLHDARRRLRDQLHAPGS